MSSLATRSRLVLTVGWLTFLILNCAIVLGYGFLHDAQGIRYAEPADALASLPPLLTLYGGYIGGILAFWFLQPFPKIRAHKWDRVRLGLGIACSLLLNVFVTLMLLAGFWQAEYVGSLEDLVGGAVMLGQRLSFVVAPVTAFYFGTK